MHTGELRNKVDLIWDAIWTGDITSQDLVETSTFDDYDLLTMFGENIASIIGIANTLHNSIIVA